MRYIWLTYIRPVLWPWYKERDTDKVLRRWLRETERGQASYQRFRATVKQYSPDADWPEQIGY